MAEADISTGSNEASSARHVLRCEECGCTSETCRGWVALLSGDPEDEDDPPIVVAYRPPCGLREFDLQERAAATDT